MKGAALARAGLVAAAWIWIAVIALAPATVFPVGRFICHQRPERSFFVRGQQLPVCARCTGLYLGAALAAPLALLATAPLHVSRARGLLAATAVPTVVTWCLEFAGIMPFSNGARFAAALPLGAAAAWLVLSTVSEPRMPRAEPVRR